MNFPVGKQSHYDFLDNRLVLAFPVSLELKSPSASAAIAVGKDTVTRGLNECLCLSESDIQKGFFQSFKNSCITDLLNNFIVYLCSAFSV